MAEPKRAEVYPRLCVSEPTAPIIPSMGFRRFASTMLALGPVIMLLSLGVYSRTYVDPFSIELDPRVSTDAVRTYSPLVAAVRKSSDQSDWEAIAKRWIAAHGSGLLEDLRPAASDDTFQRGAKAKIRAAQEVVREHLSHRARLLSLRGNHDEAVRKFILAICVLDIMKTSETVIVGYNAAQQKSLLRQMSQSLFKASPTVRDFAMSKLKESLHHQPTDQELKDLAMFEFDVRTGEKKRWGRPTMAPRQMELISESIAIGNKLKRNELWSPEAEDLGRELKVALHHQRQVTEMMKSLAAGKPISTKSREPLNVGQSYSSSPAPDERRQLGKHSPTSM